MIVTKSLEAYGQVFEKTQKSPKIAAFLVIFWLFLTSQSYDFDAIVHA